jgi:dienelactone hydrolase
MKLRWKIIIGVLVLLVILAAAGATYILTSEPEPARIVEAGPTGERIDREGVFGNYFPATAEEPRPAILVLGGSEGGLASDVTRQAVALQAQGYNALHLAYHNAPGKSAKLKNIPIEDFVQALDWLKRQDGVDPERIGIIGYSKGAEAALLVATRYPGIKAVVAGMPSSVLWNGMSPENFAISNASSSWSEEAKPLASLPYGFPGEGPGMLSVFNKGLARLNDFPEAIIPVERFKGDLLLVCGEADTLWPACPMSDQIVERAKAKGAPLVNLLRYADAGHGVMGIAAGEDDKAIRMFAQLGGTAKSNNDARQDSWGKILVFFDDKLNR